MSEVKATALSFVQLVERGLASPDGADDFVEAWHESGDEEQRPLSEYLGFSEAEFTLWLIDTRLLPDLIEARHSGKPHARIVAEHLGRMRCANDPTDGTAIYRLTHWLKARGIDA